VVMKIRAASWRWRARRRRKRTRDRFHRRKSRTSTEPPSRTFAIKGGYQVSGETARRAGQASIEYDTGYTLCGLHHPRCWLRDDETGPHKGTTMSKFVIPNLNKEDKRNTHQLGVLSSSGWIWKDALLHRRQRQVTGDESAGSGRPEADSQRDARNSAQPARCTFYLQAYESAAAPEPGFAFVTFTRPAKSSKPAVAGVGAVAKPHQNFAAEVQPVAGQAAARPLQLPDLVVNPAAQKAAFWQAPIMLSGRKALGNEQDSESDIRYDRSDGNGHALRRPNSARDIQPCWPRSGRRPKVIVGNSTTPFAPDGG